MKCRFACKRSWCPPSPGLLKKLPRFDIFFLAGRPFARRFFLRRSFTRRAYSTRLARRRPSSRVNTRLLSRSSRVDEDAGTTAIDSMSERRRRFSLAAAESFDRWDDAFAAVRFLSLLPAAIIALERRFSTVHVSGAKCRALCALTFMRRFLVCLRSGDDALPNGNNACLTVPKCANLLGLFIIELIVDVA